MREVEIQLPTGVDTLRIEQAIDAAIADAGLIVTLRDTLKKFPGCIHWHVKNGKLRGTLEITLWPQEHRAWFTIQDGRAAGWIEGKMKAMGDGLRQRLVAGD